MWLNNVVERTIRYLKSNLRFRLFLLIFLSIFPGIVLAIYSVITKQQYEGLAILIIGITSVLVAMADSLEGQTGQLKKRANQAALLSEMANEFAIQQDLSALFELIVEKTMALMDTSYASLALFDPMRGDLEIVVVKGFQVPIGTRIQLEEGAIGRAVQTRQPVIIDNDHHREGHLPEFEIHPFSAVIYVPIVYRGELIGVLGVTQSESATRKISQADVHLRSLFAGLAASAIRNARLFEDQ
jgi:GAF domain-containing protein